MEDIKNSYLTIDELSQYLNLKTSTLYSMVENGELPHYRIGRLIRFKRTDVDQWMERHRRECIDADKRAKSILKSTNRPVMDIDSIVKKTINNARKNCYTSYHGRPDQIKGLGKEVSDGTL